MQYTYVSEDIFNDTLNDDEGGKSKKWFILKYKKERIEISKD